MTFEHGRHEAKKRAMLEFFRREGKDPFAGRIEDISPSLSINDVPLSVNDIRIALERLSGVAISTNYHTPTSIFLPRPLVAFQNMSLAPYLRGPPTRPPIDAILASRDFLVDAMLP
jgi:hypothetical protein